MSLVLGANEPFRAALLAASSRTSVDASALAALVDAEARKEGGVWQQDSFHEKSHAAGLTQFLEDTWLDHAKREGTLLHETAVAKGYVKNGNVVASKKKVLLKLRFDPLLSIVSAAEYGVFNLRYLGKKGVLPSDISDDERAKYMYLAHHEGPGGAVGYLDGSRVYTAANLKGQVGKTAAEHLIARAGGDANIAYRKWLADYIDKKIVPANFRDDAHVLAVEPKLATVLATSSASAGLPIGAAYVTTDGLNFRRTPDGPIIRELTLGQPVKVTGPATGQWQPVEIDGQGGFVANTYLRLPIARLKEKLLENAIAQWVRFEKGAASEKVDPYCGYVGEMWKSIGLSYDGRSKYSDGREVPWSAAFISFVVRKSGKAYGAFRFDSSHSVFSHDAIQAQILKRTNRPFWGFRITERRPELGDIIHRNRGKGTFSFDYAENHSQFESHSDIVVEVRRHIVRVMGGNVGNTVSISRWSGGDDLQEYDLDNDGFLKPGQRIIALLKNRSNEV
ncbi:MAG: DUF2272 domain-containing protein [Bauldia sp.]|nr:DUF2272 domain-containing protein [Bauldia sp.]